MTVLPAAQERLGFFGRLNRFFYDSEIPFGLALTRIFLPWALLGALLRRWYYTRELFSTDGAAAPLWNSYGYPDMLPVPSGSVAVAMHTALIFFLVCTSLGWRTRLSVSLSFVLYTYLNLLDSVSTITKYSCIASHALLLLSLSNCGAVWSVDHWLKNRRSAAGNWPGEPATSWGRNSAWPRRLMQLMIAIVYFGAAVTKIQTPAFFSGDQLMTWLITHVNFEHPMGELLAIYPVLLVVSAYITVVWELLFLFLAFKGWGRISMLAMGIGFHLMTTVTLGLYVFPAVCLSLYFAFLNENDVRMFAWHFRRWQRRWSWLRQWTQPPRPAVAANRPRFRAPAFAVHAGALVLVTIAGLGLEHWLDPYGVRRPEGPHTLRPLSPEYAATLLGPTTPIRDVDRFFSLDVGTTIIGGVLLDRRDTFRQGDTLVAQCNISPPHGDMWVECNLHDAHDRMIDKSSVIVTREMLRASFNYSLTGSLAPGDYYLVLKKAGEEITRRKITLQPGTQQRTAALSSPVAN